MDSIPQKRCTACNQEFPATTEYFYKNSRGGLRAKCKPCTLAGNRQWKEDNPDRVRELGKLHMRRRRASDPDKVRQEYQNWRERNPDRRHEINARYEQRNRSRRSVMAQRWNEKNRPQRRIINRRSYRNNIEAARAYNRRWLRDNPEQARLNNKRSKARYRARMSDAVGDLTKRDIESLFELQDGRCGYCGVPVFDDYHVDHMIPLARGGTNLPENLCIACPECNLSKNAKTPKQWQEVRGW